MPFFTVFIRRYRLSRTLDLTSLGIPSSPLHMTIFFLILIMFLIFVGGIGFPVLMECREWLLYKRSSAKLPFRFSLFTKLAVLAFVILFVSGTILIYLLEKDHLFQDSSMSVKWINSMFYSITTRNAGLQIHDLGDFQITTLIIFSLLMFIGCSPSSVGGGIRTTTVAIIGLYLYSFLKSEYNINIFGRRIDQDDVRKSVVVFMLSLGMCFFCIVFICYRGTNTDLDHRRSNFCFWNNWFVLRDYRRLVCCRENHDCCPDVYWADWNAVYIDAVRTKRNPRSGL